MRPPNRAYTPFSRIWFSCTRSMRGLKRESTLTISKTRSWWIRILAQVLGHLQRRKRLTNRGTRKNKTKMSWKTSKRVIFSSLLEWSFWKSRKAKLNRGMKNWRLSRIKRPNVPLALSSCVSSNFWRKLRQLSVGSLKISTKRLLRAKSLSSSLTFSSITQTATSFCRNSSRFSKTSSVLKTRIFKTWSSTF